MTTNAQPAKMQQLIRSDRRMFSASDDSAMNRQIQATHTPDGREVEVKPILHVIENILHLATPAIDGISSGTREHIDPLEDKTILPGFDGILEALAFIIHRISCELSCKCSGGGDAHATTMAIFNVLSNYSWEAKVVISLAAFAVSYGEFYLVAQLFATNPLAKSVALLKQLPDIIEHSHSLKSRFDAISNLVKVVLDVTKCIVQFKDLPSQYISDDTPPMSVAVANIPAAAYWIIRSMVACMSQIISLLGMSYELITSTTEAWELSSLAHKISNIHSHLKTQLALCYQHIDEKKHVEYYQMLVRLFETPQLDNIRILKTLIYAKDDLLPLVDGTTKTRVSIEVLRRKPVLLLISDLDLLAQELEILILSYHELRLRQETHFEMVWIPIVDRSMPWSEANQQKFAHLQSEMPWHSVYHPSLLEPAVIKYIKEVWHFAKKLILVVLDPQGKVVCPNALHMMWIWGSFAHPFTTAKEEQLWKSETWRLELLVDSIDPPTVDWISAGKFVCLYGGEDIEWIRTFTKTAKDVAKAADFTIEMVYVGKTSVKERVRKIIDLITKENLSHCWIHPTSIWYFWARVESMLFSKIQHGKTVENDRIMQEVLTVLSFDGSDQGWAIIGKGNTLDIARAKGETILKSFTEYAEWEAEAKETGFIPALNNYLYKLHSPQHCNRLILPGISGGIPERVVCAECGRPMEKYFMYRCCTD
ncbi:hypothetical protein F0562_023352 [Nyssa sinensis]|uniref:Sieve element occlusion N-terminal domain-containing protein n=1 Tax=Nyssa sinensis TaxID=561372 RepID=A0A5J5BIW3_9ASTE|nr:hypothetical protein F0562_023352 [Nyssa sinensis]